MNDYEPKGRVTLLLKAMRADPDPKRLWTTAEAAEVMGCDLRKVAGRWASR